MVEPLSPTTRQRSQLIRAGAVMTPALFFLEDYRISEAYLEDFKMLRLHHWLTLVLLMPLAPAWADEFSDLRKEFKSQPPLLSNCDGTRKRTTYELLSPYYDDIGTRIRQGGPKESKIENGSKIICALNLSTKGEIGHLEVAKSSGSDDVDKDALALIKKAAPFGHLNPAITGSDHTFWVVFFDYPNVARTQLYVKSAPSQTAGR